VLEGDVLACHGGLWHVAGLSLCSSTLIQTWIVMVVIGVLGLLAARAARAGRPGHLQNLFELVVDFVAGFIGGGREVGPDHPARSRRLLFEYLATLFLFILVSNMMDVVPPYIAPTNTLNTTLALALLTFLFTHISGLARHGLRYGRSFLHTPGIGGVVMLPLAIIEELSKPLTLSFRLFGNIFAGELMLEVLFRLIPVQWFYFTGGFVPHLVWLLFSIFVGAVQSLIFMLLSLAYVQQATSEPGH
jgi:F-type H+-transporting ATPase subunit a